KVPDQFFHKLPEPLTFLGEKFKGSFPILIAPSFFAQQPDAGITVGGGYELFQKRGGQKLPFSGTNSRYRIGIVICFHVTSPPLRKKDWVNQVFQGVSCRIEQSVEGTVFLDPSVGQDKAAVQIFRNIRNMKDASRLL